MATGTARATADTVVVVGAGIVNTTWQWAAGTSGEAGRAPYKNIRERILPRG